MLWLLAELDGWINWQWFYIWIGLLSKKYGIFIRIIYWGAPWAQAPTWEKLPGAGLNNFRYSDRTRVNISWVPGPGGGVGEGGGRQGFNFDNRAFKCFHCCPTCSMWKLCRSLVLWNNKHEHKAWSMKCNHLWQMYTGGKTICITQKMFKFSFLESRHCNGVALQLQNCSEEQDIQMWHITFPSMYDAHAGLCADLSSWVRSGCSQWAGNCARMTEHFHPDDHHNQGSLAGRGQCFHCAKNNPQLLSVPGFIMTVPPKMNQ